MYFVDRNNDMRSIFDGFNSLFSGDTRLLRTDIEEDDDKYVAVVEVPGISKENVSIDFTDDTLTISVKSTNDSEKSYVRRERYSVSGSRSFYLKDADSEAIKARMENGLLFVVINKRKASIEDNKINITIE